MLHSRKNSLHVKKKQTQVHKNLLYPEVMCAISTLEQKSNFFGNKLTEMFTTLLNIFIFIVANQYVYCFEIILFSNKIFIKENEVK